MEEALGELLANDAGVAAIAGARVYANERPQGSALPALTYRRIGGPRDHAHDGPTGLVQARFQLDAWGQRHDGASGYGDAKRLIRAAIAAVDGFKGTVIGTEVRGIFTEDERDHGSETAEGTERVDRVGADIIAWYQE